MQIDPSYPDVREDYSEVLYEVARLEDSMRAARQLVTLDPTSESAGTASCVLRWRSIGAQRSRKRYGRCAHFPAILSQAGLLDYALAYGRADEARTALAEIETRWPRDAALHKRCCRGRWASRTSIQSNCARRSRTRRPGEAAGYFIARQDIDA